MISKQVMLTVLVVAATAATVAEATQYVVGEAKGWTTDFNFTAWAQDKVFYVGDTLVFNYPVSSAIVSEPLTTSHDVITLASPGFMRYICRVGEFKQCPPGQKFFINVQALPALPPTWRTPEPETWTDAPAVSPAAWTEAPVESPVSWTDAPVESPAYSWAGSPAPSPAAWTDAPEESPAHSGTAPSAKSPAVWTNTPAESPAFEGPSPRKMVGWPTPAPSADDGHS